jgi:alcohol dehydrogenase (cytochrome c)
MKSAAVTTTSNTGGRAAVLALVVLAALVAGVSLQAQVTFDRILRAASEPQNWLTYSGNVQSHRHSLLTQVTPANVKNLELQWAFQAMSLEKFEATPIALDGILYTVQAPNDIVAIDGASGRTFWTYSYKPSSQARPCCGRVNRGVAILGDALFMGTIDGRLVSVDAKSGRERWNVQIAGARPEAGYAVTVAPQIVKDKIILGPAGGDFGVRGFIAAFDPATGKELWRFDTVPGPGEPGNDTWAGESWKRGGSAVWTTGSYDPELNLVYWGTGNPGPDFNGDNRKGDNLYSNSVVALNPDTGKLAWHFQFTPHDEFDYDATQVPVLADINVQGRPRKAMLWANRNGYWYVLDRGTGEFLLGKPFTKATWTTGLDAKGRPLNMVSPTLEGVQVSPHFAGATNWYSPSFSPRTGLLYFSAWMDSSANFVKRPAEYAEGRAFIGAFPTGTSLSINGTQTNRRLPEEGYGAVLAVDPRTGQKKWEFAMTDITDAGVLTTASDLLFSGGREGFFYALDARTGTLLWKAPVAGIVQAAPMSYGIGGRQYVAIAAGNSLYAFALRP